MSIARSKSVVRHMNHMPCIRKSVEQNVRCLEQYWRWKKSLDGYQIMFLLLLDTCNGLYRYKAEGKIRSPFEEFEFAKIIKDAEEEVIHRGNYQIGKTDYWKLSILFVLLPKQCFVPAVRLVVLVWLIILNPHI